MNWVVEVARTRIQLRIPITRRAEFMVVEIRSPTTTPSKVPPPLVEPVAPQVHVSASHSQDKIRLRKAIESLRNGLPPVSIEAHRLAIGLEDLKHRVDGFLAEIASDGGAVDVIRGAYGQGKSLSLNLAGEFALQKGFWVVHTEVDATERRLDKPSNIYRSLMQSLRIPGGRGRGVSELARKVSSLTRQRIGVDGNHYLANLHSTRLWLEGELECPPLAWLLSDPDFSDKEMLRGLLEGDAGLPITHARNQHIIAGSARDWPKFSAGSQGDFACFLLSGLGRLSRLLGDKGLVVILDEMEKWQDLSWNQQTRAGNLIGGLIWGATEQDGRRERSTWQHQNVHQPEALQHSGRAGGFPFTTMRRSHLGLIIALTPRGDEGPEELWGQFGPIEIFNLPEFTQAKFSTYIETASAYYAAAYELPEPQIQVVSRRAHSLWREFGDGSTRTAVRATIQALDEWRDTLRR